MERLEKLSSEHMWDVDKRLRSFGQQVLKTQVSRQTLAELHQQMTAITAALLELADSFERGDCIGSLRRVKEELGLEDDQ